MLDVGANIGNHALYLAPNFDEIHCFEPNPVTLERLRENVTLNRSTLHIHPVGLGAADAELEFHANTSGNLGGSSFARTDFPVSGILPVRRGDAYLASHGIEGIDLIKIDVEGFEAEVLAGLVETIKRERPVIIFEYDGRTNAEAVFDRFIAALPGYRFAEFTASPGKGFGRFWGILRRGGEATIVPMERPPRDTTGPYSRFPIDQPRRSRKSKGAALRRDEHAQEHRDGAGDADLAFEPQADRRAADPDRRGEIGLGAVAKLAHVGAQLVGRHRGDQVGGGGSVHWTLV